LSFFISLRNAVGLLSARAIASDLVISCPVAEMKLGSSEKEAFWARPRIGLSSVEDCD
jgi:hypothetical protein